MQNLTDEQTAALKLEGTRCCLIAGPGSGKTHTLVARIIRDELHHDPSGIVVVTFTNAAAAEMRERLERNGMKADQFRHIGTLHSYAARSLRKAGDQRHIATDKQLNEAIQGVKRTLGAMARNMSGPEIWRHAVSPPDYGSARQVGLSVRQRLLATGLTHHDLILADFLDQIRAGKAATPERIYVDEYQDSAPIDAEIYDALGRQGASLYFIGDPRQAIYGFRGATPENLARAWESADARGQLTANFRSRPEICFLVTSIAHRMQPAGRLEYDPTVEATDRSPGQVIFADYQAEQDEQIAAAAWAATWLERGQTAAILVRYNSQATALAALLRSRGIKTTCSADQPAFDPGQPLQEAIERLQAMRPQLVPNTEAGWRAHMISLGITMSNQDALVERLAGIFTFDEMISLGEPVDADRGLLGRNQDAVAVATIHAAKGLEWDAVLFYGADAAAFPDNPEAGRLVFVAASRARRHLTVSHAASRIQPESGKILSPLALTPWL